MKKRLYAIIAVAALMVSVLAGCASAPAEEKDEPANPPEIAEIGDAKSVILVKSYENTADLSFMAVNEQGFWEEVLSTKQAWVGKNGVTNHKQEGDGCTPAGVYTLSTPFGVKDAPEGELWEDYIKLTEDEYWVDDGESKYYNTLVRKSEADETWESAEHLVEEDVAYAYACNIDYNTQCIPGNGSAIFLHCSKGNPTGGCVSVPEDVMIQLLQLINEDTVIVIQ